MEIKPTILIVKQHNKTGLKYFHKTTRLDLIESYLGSGRYWKRHLKKHGNDCTTLWKSEVFSDKDHLVEFALFFSEFYNIVESKEWANEKPENGLDGATPGVKHTEKTKYKISKARRGSVMDLGTKQQIQETLKSKYAKQELKPWNKNKPTGPCPEHSKRLKDLYQDTTWQDTKGKDKKEKCKEARLKNNPGFSSTLQCPHCNKIGQTANMKRWHMDNCKQRKK